jgi:hypothetical protein
LVMSLPMPATVEHAEIDTAVKTINNVFIVLFLLRFVVF